MVCGAIRLFLGGSIWVKLARFGKYKYMLTTAAQNALPFGIVDGGGWLGKRIRALMGPLALLVLAACSDGYVVFPTTPEGQRALGDDVEVVVLDATNIGNYTSPARGYRASSLPAGRQWIYHVGPQWAKRLCLTGDTITGAEAQQIGFALKSVPLEYLESECESLLDRLAQIDPDLLSANKRIVNVGMELMGARTLQRMAAENDARGHLAPGTKVFKDNVKEVGLKAALKARDSGFGDGRARVNGPELRDADGRLMD